MTSDHWLPENLYALFDDLCDGSISAADAARLDQLLRDDPDARWEYLCYMDVHAGLGLAKIENGAENTDQEAETFAGLPSPASLGDILASLPSPASQGDILASLPSPASGRGAGGEGGLQPENVAGSQWSAASDANPKSQIPNFPVLSTDSLSPVVLDLSGSPLAPLPSPLYIAHPFLFSNMFALLIMGIGMLGAWMYQIDIPQQIARDVRPASISTDNKLRSPADPLVFVGRITGMIDVRWADVQTATIARANVPLGRKYALASGLMEITYDTGATVLLQGPCSYQVDSRDGGYLAAGKLTAKLEKKPSAISGQLSKKTASGQQSEKVASGQKLVASEIKLPSPASGRGARGEGGQESEKVASGQWSVASEERSGVRDQGSDAANHKSEIINHKSSAPVFAVRTPTATVTDLGTEFTVHVKPDQSSEIYVIRGSVETARDSRTGGKAFRERLVAGEGICFAAIDETPRKMTAGSVRVRSVPSADASVRDVRKARAAQCILSPSALVATAYQNIWSANGALLGNDDRKLAFAMVTDGQFGRGENKTSPRSSFDTFRAAVSKDRGLEISNQQITAPSTCFVGLLYDKKTRFDRIKVFLAAQTSRGGSWAEMPKLFILKNPVDTNQIPPEEDPDDWREVAHQSLYGAFSLQAAPGPGAVFEIALTALPEEERTGYGWALGGVRGNGSERFISVTELRAYNTPDNADDRQINQ